MQPIVFRAAAAAVALALATPTGCTTTGSDDSTVAPRAYDGKQLFEGLIFGVGPVAEAVPELFEVDTEALSPEERADLEARLASAGVDEIEDLRTQLEHDERAAALRAKLIAWIDAEDPSFFPRFADSIQSGDHFEVDAALAEAADLLMRAFEADNAQNGAVGPNQITAETDPQGWFLGAFLVILAAAYASTAGAVTVVLYVQTYFWGGSDPDKGSLARERAIDVIATRLAMPQ